MARAWAGASPQARATLDLADRVLAPRLGSSLTSICFDGPPDRLNRTDVSQPAIYAASVASWHGLLSTWAMTDTDARVLAAAGLSLGEYTALTIAGSLDFETGLELVALRGRAMQDAAEQTPGGMVALIGAEESQARDLCAKAAGGQTLVCANFNAPGQIVISGDAGACARAADLAPSMGLRATPLAVAGAFHSPLMQPAADRLRQALASVDLRPPRAPVLSNVTGTPHEHPDHPERFARSVRDRLVEQLTSPVRWAENARWLAQHHGEGSAHPAEFHELAPGKTLAGLMRRTDKSVKVTTHDEP